MNEQDLPVEIWTEIKNYLTDSNDWKKLNVQSRYLYEIFKIYDVHFIDRETFFKNFEKSFQFETDNSPLSTILLKELKKRIDSQQFFYYCNLLLENRNNILSTFRILYPPWKMYDESSRYQPDETFFHKVIFALSHGSSPFGSIGEVIDNEIWKQNSFHIRINGSEESPKSTLISRQFPHLFLNSQSFSLVNSACQSDDILSKGLIQLDQMGKLLKNKFVPILPENNDDYQKMVEYAPRFEQLVDIAYCIGSPFSWEDHLKLRNMLMGEGLVYSVCISYLLCKHSFRLLAHKFDTFSEIPYRLLNSYDWERIERNIQTLLSSTLNVGHSGSSNLFVFLTMHPESLKNRVELIKLSPIDMRQNEKCHLLTLSVSKLKIINKFPIIITKSLKNLVNLRFFVEKLQDCPIEALELFILSEIWLKNSTSVEKINLFHYATLLDHEELIRRFHQYCPYLQHQQKIRDRRMTFFNQSLNGENCLEKIFFDSKIFPSVSDLYQFLTKFQSLHHTYYDKSIRSLLLAFLPTKIRQEFIMWERSIPQNVEYDSTKMMNFLLKFSTEEIDQVWKIIQQHYTSVVLHFYNNVKTLPQLITFSENFENRNSIEPFGELFLHHPAVLMNNDAKTINQKFKFIKSFKLLSGKIDAQLMNFDDEQLLVISQNLDKLQKMTNEIIQIDISFLKRYSPNELNLFFIQ